MTRSATLTQLPANDIAATEIVDRAPTAAAGPSTVPLRALAGGTGTALHPVDLKRADGETVELLTRSQDVLAVPKAHLTILLHARRHDVSARPGSTEGLPGLFGDQGLEGPVRGGTRLPDLAQEALEIFAAPEAPTRFERHRAQDRPGA